LCSEALSDSFLPRWYRARYHTFHSLCIEEGADVEIEKAQATLNEVKATLPPAQGNAHTEEFRRRVDRLQMTVNTIRDECIETREVEVDIEPSGEKEEEPDTTA